MTDPTSADALRPDDDAFAEDESLAVDQAPEDDDLPDDEVFPDDVVADEGLPFEQPPGDEASAVPMPSAPDEDEEEVPPPPQVFIGELSTRPVADGRLDVRIGGTVVRTLLVLRPGSDRLAVFANGAVRLSTAKNPDEIFQRSSWADQIDANCLFLSDSTVNRAARIGLGWGQGSAAEFFLTAASSVIRNYAAAIGVERPERRLYYGSCGGGFQSLILAGLDPGSRVLVNNPQIVWTNYVGTKEVSRVLDTVYDGLSKAEFAAAYPDRVSPTSLYTLLARVPEITYLVNAASRSDMTRDVRALQASLTRIAPHLTAPLTLRYYWDKAAGHSPLGKEQTIRAINDELRRLEGDSDAQ
ncbi:hypothetical protein GGQ54_002011 [Naumannella cuiyingiana]|uniref:Uncharacterized protein n=1 Tax=Naumannella cuiyingiana TaxID=1347891 RepID=A0A7Z0ILD7_9ACTN|nr:hypothetical protein [Naumannella cuiyingiana]NYI71451.1 hypothetical protein [Naumannella cuiyingiana]